MSLKSIMKELAARHKGDVVKNEPQGLTKPAAAPPAQIPKTIQIEKMTPLELYQILTPSEKAVINTVSIISERVNELNLLKCLQKAKIRDGLGVYFIQKTLQNVLTKLRLYRLLVAQKSWIECADNMIEPIMYEASLQPDFPELVAAVRLILPIDLKNVYSSYYLNVERCIRELRIAIYTRDIGVLDRTLGLIERFYPGELSRRGLFQRIFTNPFRPEWFRTMPTMLQYNLLRGTFLNSLLNIQSNNFLAEYIQHYFLDIKDDETASMMRGVLIDLFILQGKFAAAQQIIDKDPDFSGAFVHKGCLEFLHNQNELSLYSFELGLKILRRNNNRRNSYFDEIPGIFYALALLKTQDLEKIPALEKMLVQLLKQQDLFGLSYLALQALLLVKQSRVDQAKELFLKNFRPDLHIDGFSTLIGCLVIYWVFPKELGRYDSHLRTVYEKALNAGYKWLAMEYACLLGSFSRDAKTFAEQAVKLQKELGVSSIIHTQPREEEWQRALKALALMGMDKRKDATTEVRTMRLAWLVDFDNKQVSPKEQKLSKNGAWTKGRNVALDRLKNGELDCVTPQDLKVVGAIETHTRYGYYGGSFYEFDFDKALLALVGHPNLFLEKSPEVSVELIKADPELIVDRSGNDYEIKFTIDANKVGVHLIRETPTRYKVVEITESFQQIATTFGGKSLRVPEAGKEALLKAIGHLSSMVTVHSVIGGVDESIPLVEADSKCYVHLLPMSGGFKLEIFVKPFGANGPYFGPSHGGENVLAEIGGKRVQTRRDLKTEKKSQEQILKACPTLRESDDGTGVWTFDSPEACLQVLMELNELRETVPVEWPEGGKISVTNAVSFDQLALRVQKKNDWFSLTGELQVDENTVLDMRRLLELVDANKGRFIPLGNDQYLALTDTFRKRLDEMMAYAEIHKDGARFHPLAALTLQDHFDEIKQLKVDKAWKEHLQKLKELDNYHPVVPSTFQAELREYQVDGFKWLSRLAHWGVGACLADDMGLGKTVQGLAVILDRAKNGPTLVVCPASVTFNWVQEAQRFAPTLKPVILAGKEREEQINKLGPFDLLICSYALLHYEAEALAKTHWSTIVLDEAQAIKNVMTKRSKAAMDLQGDFKIITTGTPIENHLGELWNLFNFINPGLLGSLQRFNERFAYPIEKYKDPNARKRLKRLVHPFMLRRLKNEVLDELPPKTEITLTVQLSKEEAAFYEAMRLRTIEQLARIEDGSGNAGEKHLKILAEIMKLRRACCHTKLVTKDSPLESSKMAVFEEIIDELRENRHKALVFSQFVGYLEIIREVVERKKIPYQYLDGSTPIKDREKRVNAFQAGEGDLFLISLRAGGQGLNLTAADYVIHMDPWWNPAVEDQASDRAHRIGQQRPVTIYRLVTQHTIEEKIVNLHREKRDLADSLLEGAESSGKINAEQLLALIREN